MKTTITLENKEVRMIIARYLGIKEEDVIPNRYNFSVVGLACEDIEKKINVK